ncbi:MAG: HAD family hydrolase [Cellulosilyticaceae bacterium]
MSNKYDAVIFDLDGTLIDSMWVWKKIDEVFCETHKITLPIDIDNELEGKSFTETAHFFKERFELVVSVEEIKEHWNELAFTFYTSEVHLKTGVMTFLEYLKERNIKMGIATSNSTYLVMAVLKYLKIEQFFDFVCTSCEVEKGKPHPFVYLKVAEKLDILPEKCLVFEDVANGIRAGKNAGMDVWAVNDGQDEKVIEILKNLADDFVDDYDEVLMKFKNLN